MIFRLPFNLPGLHGIALIFIGLVSRDAPKTTPNHEYIHILQWMETFIVGFLPIYLYDYFKGRYRGLTHHQAYLNIRLERDARRWQDDPYQRPWYNWLAD